MKLICFEDRFVSQLQPITHARPAYAITCASNQLIDWLRLLPGELTVSIRNYLAQIQFLDPGLSAPEKSAVAGEDVLLVNARLVPRVETLRHLQTLCKSDASGMIRCAETDVVLAARLTPKDSSRIITDAPQPPSTVAEASSPFEKPWRQIYIKSINTNWIINYCIRCIFHVHNFFSGIAAVTHFREWLNSQSGNQYNGNANDNGFGVNILACC